MNKKVKQGVITAAGFGTRFLPIVKSIPKEMLPVRHKPILQYVVEEFIGAGIDKIVIIVRKGNNIIYDYFKNPSTEIKDLLTSVGKAERFTEVEKILEMADKITIVEQDDTLPYGNGSPIISARGCLEAGSPFAVAFADDLVKTDMADNAIKQLMNVYESNESVGALLGAQIINPSEVYKYGCIRTKDVTLKQGIIEDIIEKPKIGEEPSNIISVGRFVLPYDIFQYLDPKNRGLDHEVWLQDANTKLAQDVNFYYNVIDGVWYTTGDPITYKIACDAYCE